MSEWIGYEARAYGEQDAAAALIERVVDAAAGTVVAYTDLAPRLQTLTPNGPSTTYYSGFQKFGDGLGRKQEQSIDHLLQPVGSRNKILDANTGNYATEMVEVVAFRHVLDPVYEDRPVQRPATRLFERPKVTYGREKIGENLRTRFNPEVGEEPLVYFEYAFNPNLSNSSNRLPYMGVSSPRTGNFLVVSSVLPQGLAYLLHQAIHYTPAVARQATERLVIARGGLSQQQWDVGEDGRRTRPPFELNTELYRITYKTPPKNNVLNDLTLVAKKLDRSL